VSRRHTQAVKAKIQEIAALATKTHLGIAQKDSAGKIPAPPLVLIHPAGGTDTQERLAGPRSTQHPRFTLHIVGSSIDNVETIRDAVKAKFVVNGRGVPPTVAGEVTSALSWDEPTPIQWDTDLTPPVPYAVVELGFTADPV